MVKTAAALHNLGANTRARSGLPDCLRPQVTPTALKPGTLVSAEIDSLMGLVQEVAEFVRATGRFGDAVWVSTENTPIYSQEHLGELGQFTSVLTLTLREMTA